MSDSCVWSPSLCQSVTTQPMITYCTGIVYSDGLKRTVPMAVLKQDKAEGKQVESSAYEVWRVLKRHQKIIIYSSLGAVHQGQDADAFMQEYYRTAQDVMTAAKGKRGPKPC